MAQDLLAALGARIEAQLKIRGARVRSIEDSVKAQVSANPPAPFTLLSDGTKQFGYAPAAAVTTTLIANSAPADSTDAVANAPSAEVSEDAEIVSDTAAPIAALLNATARIFTTAAAETKAVEHLPVESSLLAAITPATEIRVFSNVSAYMEAVLAKPAVVAEPVTEALPVVATPPEARTAAPEAAARATSARTLADSASLGYTMLSDGTKQFGYAPSGGLINTGPPNTTPPVPADFGVGATMRRHGVRSDTPITVTRVGDGLVFANFTDGEGTREMAFYPNQMDLVTAAP
ncbi:MAG: hypothetical protein ABI120_06205 [Gemmatimonadaceae bacterium]